MMLSNRQSSDRSQQDLSKTSEADPDELNNLVEQFSAFLQQNGKDVLASLEQQNTPQNSVTLYSLFGELAALKNEVKRESMQVKDAVGQFTGLLDTLRENNQQLSVELERQQHQDEKTSFAYRFPLLEDVLDLNDSLQHTLESTKKYKPSYAAMDNVESFIGNMSLMTVSTGPAVKR